MKNKIIKNLSISVAAIGFLFPFAHLNASAAEAQNNNEVPQVNMTTEDNNDVSRQNSSQNSQHTQNQDVQPPNKPEINNDASDPATNVPKQDENNNPASTADDDRTPNKEEASHPNSSGAQETSNNETNGNQTQNSNNPSEKTDENAAGPKPNTNTNNASTNNENNSAGKSSEGHQPDESKSPANNTKDENAGEPNHPNASSNGQGNGNTHPTNTGEHNETTKPNQQPGKSEGNSSNVDPNDGKGGSGSHSTHVKNDGSEKEGTGTAQPNKGTEQPESPNKPKQPHPPKGNQNPKVPSQNHQTPTPRPQPDWNKNSQQTTNTTGRKENNQYKEKGGNAKSPNNSNKIPTRNWDSYPFPKTSGTTEQQNEKSTSRNSWKGNLYNNLTQSPTQQKASDERIHKASQYLVPFTTMNLAGNRFGHIVTGSFKYNPFVINQVSRMSEDSKTTEGDIHSALEHQNFASNRDLNNLQESTGYFKYQFFNPADAQQYYDNLDVQVLGLITGDIGSMPDLKRTKKSANFEVGSTNNAKDYSEKIDNTQKEEKETKTESENTEKSHPRLIATLLATFGAAFIWFIILMFIHRRNDDNQEKED
ncbi:serine-aspartate repeat family protein [Staphylococcus piscifermentans]|nr:SdrH family protein [Staphylococcus piscifermentans]SNV01379.1 serine-aspartate repeat family protein [Staphylococcus piscifermentans]